MKRGGGRMGRKEGLPFAFKAHGLQPPVSRASISLFRPLPFRATLAGPSGFPTAKWRALLPFFPCSSSLSSQFGSTFHFRSCSETTLIRCTYAVGLLTRQRNTVRYLVVVEPPSNIMITPPL